MICRKCLDTYCVLPEGPSEDKNLFSGFYFNDTRFLSRYSWTFSAALPLSRVNIDSSSFSEIFCSPERHRGDWAIIRTLRLGAEGFEDRLVMENHSLERRSIALSLSAAADFADMMALRLRKHSGNKPEVSLVRNFTWAAFAGDGLRMETEIDFSDSPSTAEGGKATFEFDVPPGEKASLIVHARFLMGESTARQAKNAWIPSLEDLRSRFSSLTGPGFAYADVAEVALRDLHSLLLRKGENLVIAAGLPYFAVPFGRDSLIAAGFLLDRFPELAEGCLRYAASIQGSREDPSRQEEPGKIYHEARPGELSRRNVIPFSRYYGSADSTPLFLILLDRVAIKRGDDALSNQLEGNWRSALSWLFGKLDSGGGFIRFQADPGEDGLKIQSWKDSKDSMNFRDGNLAVPPIAVSEIQAYAYEALTASSGLAKRRGDHGLAEECARRAEALAARIKESFWLPSSSIYGLAIDGKDRVLDTPASDAGYLLPYGFETAEAADALAARLFETDLFSGWGIRTLSSRARSYNPLSYHNGSVWPHDNAIIAEALFSRGLKDKALKLCDAVLTAVSQLPGKRAPELFTGYSKEEFSAPIPHPFSCSPQAWSAAGVLRLCEIRSACAAGRDPRRA